MADPTAPVLVTPEDYASVFGNVLVFVFTVPTDADNHDLVFRVELDTNSVINESSSDYKKYESRYFKSNGLWEVKDNGTYITMASGGISSSYYGADARCTLMKQRNVSTYPERNTRWYWKISASDNINCAVFNKVVYAQAVFCGRIGAGGYNF